LSSFDHAAGYAVRRELFRKLPGMPMEIDDKHYGALKAAYIKSAEAVEWAYVHWALDAGLESALRDVMGEDVSEAVIDLLKAVEALLSDGRVPPNRSLPCVSRTMIQRMYPPK
jgi:hypothetical protein